MLRCAGPAPQLAKAVHGLVRELARDHADAARVEARLAPVPRAERAQAQQRHRAVAVRRAHACRRTRPTLLLAANLEDGASSNAAPAGLRACTRP